MRGTIVKPEKCEVIECKCVFKCKRSECNEFNFKAALAAKGIQQSNVDLLNLYSPLAILTSLGILLSIFNVNNISIYQLDVCSACLNGNVVGDVFISLLKGWENIKVSGMKDLMV